MTPDIPSVSTRPSSTRTGPQRRQSNPPASPGARCMASECASATPPPGGDLLVGEGIETVLSLRMAFPHLPAVAALSAGSLATLNLPWTPARLLIAADRDRPGLRCARTLMQRVREDGITAVVLLPKGGDFNDDLLALGPPAFAARVQKQLKRRGERMI